MTACAKKEDNFPSTESTVETSEKEQAALINFT